MIKKLSIGLFVVAIASGAFFYYYWRQVTKLPEWYVDQAPTHQQTINLQDQAAIQTTKQELVNKIETDIQQQLASQSRDGLSKGQVEVKLNQQELNDLLVTSIAEKPGSSKLLAAAKGINTTIEDGKIESGVVVNTSEIPVETLGTSERTVLQKVLTTFPSLENRDVYIGIEGQPKLENGQLQFDDNTKIKVGNLSLTLAELSQRLGVPQEKIERQLALKLEGFDIRDLELVDNQVVVKGAVN